MQKELNSGDVNERKNEHKQKKKCEGHSKKSAL